MAQEQVPQGLTRQARASRCIGALLATACVALATTAPALGAQRSPGGRTALVVLDLPTSPRAQALGGASALLHGDVEGAFFNPALLGATRGAGAAVALQPYVEGTTLLALAAAAPVAGGRLSLTAQRLDFGSVDEISREQGSQDEFGSPTGEQVSADELAVAVSWARAVGPFTVGAGARALYARVAEQSSTGAAFDVGAVGVARGVVWTAALQHLGGSLTLGNVTAPLPWTVRLGAGTPMFSRGPVGIRGGVELVREGGAAITEIGGGGELRWRAREGLGVMLRVGARSRPGGSFHAPLSFGAGIAARRLALDVAVQPLRGLSGTTTRVGLRWWQ